MSENHSNNNNNHSNQMDSTTTSETTTTINPTILDDDDDTYAYYDCDWISSSSPSTTTQSNNNNNTPPTIQSMQHNSNDDNMLSLDTWDEKRLHYWFSIALIQGVLQLPLCDLKPCTLVCKSISTLARDYMQHNFWFQQYNSFYYNYKKNECDSEKRYLVYSPCHFKNVKSLSTLPINTTKIQFYQTFNSPFTFPIHLQQVTHITFGSLFKQPIGCGIKSEINNLPLTLTHLEFSDSYFNNSVNDLPPNLSFLLCGFAFNNLVDSLPLKLTHLTLSDHFNQPINKLPLSLTHLTFTNFHQIKFKQPLDQLQKHFESNLEYLVLSPLFIQRYKSSIPLNFMRLGESQQYKDHIVYKRQQQQQQITNNK